MATAPLRTIRSIEPRQNFRLSLVLDTGFRAIVDLSASIEQGGVFGSLKDVELFKKVRIGERRRTIEWPNPQDDLGYPLLDIDVDALVEMSLAQRRSISFVKIQSIIREATRSAEKIHDRSR